MAKKNKTTSKTGTSGKTNGASKTPAKIDPDRVPITQIDRATKVAKAEKKMTCLDAAVAVLKTKGEPMTTGAMIDAMQAKKLWTTDAPTPAATLYSAILRELKTKKNEARFKKTDRGLFALK